MDSQNPNITKWMQLIRAEYEEMPGLHLTKPQMQRLWGLDRHTCERLLDVLVGAQVLRRTGTDGYVRHDPGY